jgi:hypothetical protein
MAVTHENHYVAQWLQKRFFNSGYNAYYYCDINPDVYCKSDGSYHKHQAIHYWPSKRCFKATDLYTRLIFGEENDDIEQRLFGVIDDKGAKGLPIFLEGNFTKNLSEAWHYLIAFMDAQKLRTPRMLTYINKSLVSKLGNSVSHEMTLHLMQRLRQMHITTWTECVWEIVSAKMADIKFIISDQPVTLYNPACYPQSQYCRYPNSPEIFWLGTRTIFPMDLEHCLILTNLEYAKAYKKCKPMKTRTNPRVFQSSIFDLTKVIRERLLSNDEVTQINYIIKMLATKYIAGSNEEFLYPERKLPKVAWPSLNKVLLPDTAKIKNVIATVVGFADGTAYGADPLGRPVPDPQKMAREMKEKLDSLLKKR